MRGAIKPVKKAEAANQKKREADKTT